MPVSKAIFGVDDIVALPEPAAGKEMTTPYSHLLQIGCKKCK
jgi:hypothetical protein